MSKTPLSDLLALRDGEPLSAEARAALAGDETSAMRLARLADIKAALNELPDPVPDEALYEQIQARLQERRSEGNGANPSAPHTEQDPKVSTLFATPTAPAARWRLRYPLATAASVFMLAVLGSVLWLPEVTDAPDTGPTPIAGVTSTGDAPTALPAASVAALMDRSQQLEAVARLPVSSGTAQPAQSRQALLYRIADLDAELNALIEEEPMNPQLKEKLWRQRVDLLETLVAIQQEQMADAAGLY
ncbi:MAG: hypothetical protein AAGI15_03600 [Pseudomonadota bacterium]